MAINTDNPFGTISGSIGGMTFTQTKGRSVIRKKVTPTNPNSTAQVITKRNLGGNSKNWKNQSPSDQSDWSNFASTNFSPLKKSNVGQYSGYNAFVSCLNMYKNQYLKFQRYQIVFPFLGNTYVIYEHATPVLLGPVPLNTVVPEFKSPIAGGAVLSIDDIGIDTNGYLLFSCFWGLGNPRPLAITPFRDGNDMDFGIIFFMSSGYSSPGGIPKSKYKYCLGTTSYIPYTVLNQNSCTQFNIEMDFRLNKAKWKSFPQPGQYVTIYAGALDIRGTASFIGSFEFQLAKGYLSPF